MPLIFRPRWLGDSGASSPAPNDKASIKYQSATRPWVLAEYYATRGIDDLRLVEDLRAAGFEIVWHKRRASGRYACTRRLVEWTGEKTEFELLLRSPAAGPSAGGV